MKRTIILLTAIITAFAVLTSCGKKDSKIKEANEKAFVTDAKGQEVTNEAGLVAIKVTDDNGEPVTDENGEEKTTYVDREKVTVEFVTGSDGRKKLNSKGEYITVARILEEKIVTNKDSSVQTTKQAETNTTTANNEKAETTLPAGSTTKTSERLFESKVLPVFKSGKFTMQMTLSGDMDGSGVMSVPATIVNDSSNSRFFMETSMNSLKYQFILKNNKMYLVMPSMKIYSEMDYSAEEAGMSDMMKELTDGLASSNAKYVKTTTVKDNGVEYICEEYKEATTTNKYYFKKSDKKLARIETYESESGQTTVVIVEKLEAGAPENYFQIPSGYKKFDIEKLAGLLGQ